MEDFNSDNWKLVQTKTFTKWLNSKLKKAGFTPVDNIFTGLSTGVSLVNLLQALGKEVPKYNQKPFSRIQKMENMTNILDCIKKQNISLVNIGPEDIVDGDQKLILGLIWTLISKMSFSDILSSEFLSLRDEILSWAQRVTSNYNNVDIENLTTSWQDGLAFNAIIHRFRPNLIPDFFKLSNTEKYDNCAKAFSIAEEHLDIPKLLDPEDIIDAIRPDEKSILTYLTQFYQKFSQEEEETIAKDQISSLIRGVNYSIEAKHSYELKAKQFLEKKQGMGDKLKLISNLSSTLTNEIKNLEIFNNELIHDSVYLINLLNNIYDINETFGLKKYTPPENYSVDKIRTQYYIPEDSMDLVELQAAVEQFGNSEAKEIEKLRKVSFDMLSALNKENQISLINTDNLAVKPILFSSPSKQKTFDYIRETIENRKQKLNLYLDLKKATSSLINEAVALFDSKTSDSCGFIGRSDLMKILKMLRFESVVSVKNYIGDAEKISKEMMIEILTKVRLSQPSKPQIQKAFSIVSKNCGSIKESCTKGNDVIISDNDVKIEFKNVVGSQSLKGLKQVIADEGGINFSELQMFLD